MKKKLNKIAKDTNTFLSKFLISQKKTELVKPMRYGLLPGGKKIRSKLIVDVGKIFNIEYKKALGITKHLIQPYALRIGVTFWKK